jgi:hypothetical protein
MMYGLQEVTETYIKQENQTQQSQTTMSVHHLP